MSTTPAITASQASRRRICPQCKRLRFLLPSLGGLCTRSCLRAAEADPQHVYSFEVWPAEGPVASWPLRIPGTLNVTAGDDRTARQLAEAQLKPGLVLGATSHHRGRCVPAHPGIDSRRMTVDDVITAVTRAETKQDAARVMSEVRSGELVRAVADQLHIDPEGHELPWLRRAIVNEAKS